jgi:hypothetical protein
MAEPASIIGEFKLLLAQQLPITLNNVYKEVPIVNEASICEVQGDRLLLETNELQICAMHWGGGTVIQAPALSAPVEAQLDGIDIQRQMVTLSGFRNRTPQIAPRDCAGAPEDSAAHNSSYRN